MLDKHCYECKYWTTSVAKEPCKNCEDHNNFIKKEVEVNE